MTPGLLATAALSGYVVGSISFSRVIAARVLPGIDLAETTFEGADGAPEIVSRGVSSSGIGARAGKGWGCLTTLLDIAKCVTVTGAFAMLAPGTGAAEIAGAAAVVGHGYPALCRRIGGFGQSPILGALLVLDWPSIPFATLVMFGVGLVLAQSLVAYEAWPLMLIAWFGMRGDRPGLAFAVVANVVYWSRMWPEVRQWVAHQRSAKPTWRERLREITRGYP